MKTLFDTITETGAKLVAAGFKPEQIRFTIAGSDRVKLADELQEKFGFRIVGDPHTCGIVGGFQVEFARVDQPGGATWVCLTLT